VQAQFPPAERPSRPDLLLAVLRRRYELRLLRTSFNATRACSGALSKKLILMLVVFALLAAGYMLFGQPAGAEADGEELPDGATEEIAEEDQEPLARPVVYKLGDFLVNVQTNDELRYLRVEVAASIRDYGTDEEAGGHGGGHGGGGDDDGELPSLEAEHEALSRDAIVRILSESGFATLRTEPGREQAKERIRATLTDTLGDAHVESVLFLSFVMQ